MSENELGLFAGKDMPDVKSAWDYYEKGLQFNRAINLDDTIKANRNFYIGKQWQGVQANGLPTPVFNVLKRVVGFTIANINSDNLSVISTTLENMANKKELQTLVQVVNDECAALMEHNEVPALVREFSRNAAVDGSGCMFSYWDPDVPVGNGVMGAVKTEIILCNRVIFGNPNDRSVQDQPFIQIASREMVRSAKKRAKANGESNWQQIQADDAEDQTEDGVKRTDDKVTVILTLWKDEESGEMCFLPPEAMNF